MILDFGDDKKVSGRKSASHGKAYFSFSINAIIRRLKSLGDSIIRKWPAPVISLYSELG
jgi:hypothetical protein